jgi:ABC-type phosphate/phosphonate transport system permease subunit
LSTLRIPDFLLYLFTFYCFRIDIDSGLFEKCVTMIQSQSQKNFEPNTSSYTLIISSYYFPAILTKALTTSRIILISPFIAFLSCIISFLLLNLLEQSMTHKSSLEQDPMVYFCTRSVADTGNVYSPMSKFPNELLPLPVGPSKIIVFTIIINNGEAN